MKLRSCLGLLVLSMPAPAHTLSAAERKTSYYFEIPMRWVKPGDTLADQQCFGYADKIVEAYPAGKVTHRQKNFRKQLAAIPNP